MERRPGNAALLSALLVGLYSGCDQSAGLPVASPGTTETPADGTAEPQDLRGCAADPIYTAGLNEIPNYDRIPAPALPRFIRDAERPAQVDLSACVPTPCNQGQLNSCAGWVGAYGLMTYLAAHNVEGWVELDRADRHFSPTFVFNQANAFRMGRSRYDSCRRAGTFLTDMLTLLRDTGAVRWVDLPYTESDCETPASADVLERAGDFRLAYFRSVQRDVSEMQSYLSVEVPVVVTVRVGEAFTLLAPGEVYDLVEDANSFAHALLVVGYDDGIGAAGAIKVMNSWGTQWGDGGFGFIAYEVWPDIAREAFVAGHELLTGIDSLTGRMIPPDELQNALRDSDADGYPDTMEDELRMNKWYADDNPGYVPPVDADTDGWPDEEEELFGTDPHAAGDLPFRTDYAFPAGFFSLYTAGRVRSGIVDPSGELERTIEFSPAAYAVGKGPRALSATDLDGDGDVDLLVANGGSHDVSILLNDGRGRFETSAEIPVLGAPTFVTLADLNGDACPDLALGLEIPGGIGLVTTLLNDGRGGFADLAVSLDLGGGAVAATSADLNGDGALDLAVAIAVLNSVAVLENNGNGAFVQGAVVLFESAPTSLNAADYDGDGDFDLAVGLEGTDQVQWLSADRDGGFTLGGQILIGVEAHGLATADLNGDGYPDMAAAGYAEATGGVALNNGDATFGSVAGYAVGYGPRAAHSGDLDGDGDEDLVVVNELSASVSVLVNAGRGRFLPAFDFPTTGRPVDMALADFDGDDRLDVATADFGADEDEVGAVTVMLSSSIR